MKALKTITFYRYIQSGEPKGAILHFLIRDETGKCTIAKYKLVKVLETNIKDLYNYVWRLDGRSIRYMKRVKIIENLKGSAKRWKHLRN